MSNREKIGVAITELRNEKGISLRQLEVLSGVHFTNIGKIEKGVYNASMDVLEKILQALDAELVIKKKSSDDK